ncbi:MAG: AmmeMemoRadiSam system protein B, partial [Opitutales bacterium]
MKRHLPLFSAATLVLCALPSVQPAPSPGPEQKIREPAVAGLFYPADPAALSHDIDAYLAAAKAGAPGRLRALICPHAGYPYSGPVAASGFRLLPGTGFSTVLLLAPSHYAYLQAASVSDADIFRTPLGDVPISSRARQLAQWPPFQLEPVCEVQRPEWADHSSRRPPADGRETADTWEHAGEVEVPFLQKTLGPFQLVPVVFGDVDPPAAARALARVLDDRTLVVVSSDLSHYHPYAEAVALDHRCIEAILALDVTQMARQEACGRIPILALLHLARQQGWQARLLDYRNSGDTSGDKSRVVGYAAIAFYEPAAASLTPAERHLLLGLA